MAEALASTPESADVYERLAVLAAAMNDLAERHEPELRIMMRAAMDEHAAGGPDDPQVRARGVRRLAWIESALAPVRDRLGPERQTRVVHSLAVCLGFDALIVLRDICGVTGQAATDLMTSMAVAILDSALAEADAEAGRPAGR